MFAAIETSFDETGISILSPSGELVVSLLASQIERHKPYGGCVPELAARTHLSDLPQMWRTIDLDLIEHITHFGVTAGPGLPGCLLAGVNFARGVSHTLKTPLYGLNHLQGHIFSPFMPSRAFPAGREIPFPHLALLISGGHTELFLVESLTEICRLGQTVDDAVGELLDKISAVLGYGYPGGAELEKVALRSPELIDGHYHGAYELPVPMLSSPDLNFSYSGLKTAMLRIIRYGDLSSDSVIDQQEHPSLLACLFDTVAKSLWIKVKKAIEQTDVKTVTLSGGVAINSIIRQRFAENAMARDVSLMLPAKRYCLDNSDMMAWLLKLLVEAGIVPTAFDADSNWNPEQQVGANQ